MNKRRLWGSMQPALNGRFWVLGTRGQRAESAHGWPFGLTYGLPDRRQSFTVLSMAEGGRRESA